MSIILTPDGGSAIALPDQLIWVDEGSWQAAISNRTVTTTGGQIIQGGVLQAGRPITLAGAIDRGWISRADWLALLAEANVFGTEYELELNDGQTFDVEWAPGPQRISAEPVLPFIEPDPGDDYRITLRFITV